MEAEKRRTDGVGATLVASLVWAALAIAITTAAVPTPRHATSFCATIVTPKRDTSHMNDASRFTEKRQQPKCYPSFLHCLLNTGSASKCKPTSPKPDVTYWDSGKRHAERRVSLDNNGLVNVVD